MHKRFQPLLISGGRARIWTNPFLPGKEAAWYASILSRRMESIASVLHPNRVAGKYRFVVGFDLRLLPEMIPAVMSQEDATGEMPGLP